MEVDLISRDEIVEIQAFVAASVKNEPRTTRGKIAPAGAGVVLFVRRRSERIEVIRFLAIGGAKEGAAITMRVMLLLLRSYDQSIPFTFHMKDTGPQRRLDLNFAKPRKIPYANAVEWLHLQSMAHRFVIECITEATMTKALREAERLARRASTEAYSRGLWNNDKIALVRKS